jgi:hypothetical protein
MNRSVAIPWALAIDSQLSPEPTVYNVPLQVATGDEDVVDTSAVVVIDIVYGKLEAGMPQDDNVDEKDPGSILTCPYVESSMAAP